jgi:hypothetical protein
MEGLDSVFCDNTATCTFFEMHGLRPVVYGPLPLYFRSKP